MAEQISKKANIRKYIAEVIKNSDHGKKIPSEEFISRKFKCARETVRVAIRKYVYLGFLIPVKGKGYIITNKYKDLNYNFNVDTKELKTKVEILENFSIDKRIEKSFSYIKKYIYRNEVIAWSICTVNKEIVYKITLDDVKGGLINFIVASGIDIYKLEKKVRLINSIKLWLPKESKIPEPELDGNSPIVDTILFNKSGEILEVSKVIINPIFFTAESHIFL